MTAALIPLTAIAGAVVAWLLTVPLHSYKELRPMTPRDVAAEAATDPDGRPAPPVRAAYRTARCGRCRHECRTIDVVPVVSWIRGCPDCGERLPLTVPLLQVGLPLAMATTVALLPGSWVALPYVFLAVVLAAIAVVDLRIWLIPWWMPWAGAAAGLVLISAVSVGIGAPRQIVVALAGGVATFVVFFLLYVAAPGKLGFGDVRLSLLLGIFLAWMHPVLPVYGLLFGAVLGLVMGVAAIIARGDSRFPFGPGLALGAMAAVWFHEPLLRGLG